ncbi:MAG: ATP synthase F1 subunit delta [Sphingobacteriaceae bacterium]
MSELNVTSRYAKSLIDLAEEQKSLEAVKSDMQLFAATVKGNPEFKAVLANPIVSPDKKVSILKAIFSKSVSNATIGFLVIMVKKGRAGLLYATAKEFVRQYNVKKNIVKASVVSATPLSAENEKQIVQLIHQTTGGEIVLDVKVDPALIGGFVLKVGDKQFDASISNGLHKLKKSFAQKVITLG